MSDFEEDEEDKSTVRLYNEYDTYNERLEEITNINKATTAAANIEMELENRGPIYNLLMGARNDSVSALIDILATDPRDSVEISRLQQEAKSFSKMCDHIRGTMEYAKEADKFIKEEYGENG